MEAVARFDFVAANPLDEMSFSQSSTLNLLVCFSVSLASVVNQDQMKGWCFAQRGSRTGLVPANYLHVKPHQWYFGNVTESGAEKLLQNQHEGAFLLRDGDFSKWGFYLSVKSADAVEHFRVNLNDKGKFYIWSTVFNSLNKLVVNYPYSGFLINKLLLQDIPQLITVQAIADFDAQESGQLSFQKGDIIKVVEREDPQWWLGATAGRVGFFPAQDVQELIPTYQLYSK